jgi:hypothetical protein
MNPSLSLSILVLACPCLADPGVTDATAVAEIRTDIATGFANGGWSYDRYEDLKALNARSQITVADLAGPGVIRHIHSTRHHPEELLSRGIVLEIWFDNAGEPAVLCPLADFFGDGCNGQSMDFSSNLIECAPWSYNGYFVMPFKSRARVLLRNDTDNDVANYSYVEWEKLPAWNEKWGYFHASYRRKCFQLTKDTDETFFEVTGTGHLLGRQFSVVTDEPFFHGFHTVMEGNNEVDIDGQARRLDYLGTEDSFGFSWGFRGTFIGKRAGMTFNEHGDLNRMSIFRFHDHMPIRFNRSLRWHINWQQEKLFTGKPKWRKAVAKEGCWVDCASVFYWYQDHPGGYQHAALQPVGEREKVLLRSSVQPTSTAGP